MDMDKSVPIAESVGPPSPGPGEQLADERELLRRFAKDNSPTVREELVDRFMPLARRLAARYAGGAEPFDDLVQVASVGLVKAIDRFDPERGTAFSTFAVPTILGELKRHFRDRGWSVHVPRDVQERILKVERASAELPAKLGHAPTVREIAQRIEASEEEVLEAMHAAQGHHAVSLDAASTIGDGDEPTPLGDRIGEEDPSFNTVEYGAAIAPVLEEISERDRRVLHLRFVEDMTQSEIAERVGVSQMHVSRILRAAVDKLRREVPQGEDE
jgi:RNA polymerase sigma-B factor